MSRAPMPGAEGLAEPLRSRWSPAVFDDRHRLTDTQVETLLRAAQWAPSSGNMQPWAFVVVRRDADGHEQLRSRLSRGNSTWVPRASAVFLVAARVAEEPGGRGIMDGPYHYYDTGQAAAHLTLQARAMGLHAHQFAGFDRAGTAAALGLPPHLELVAGIAVGVLGDPDTATERDRDRHLHKVRQRRDLPEFAHVGRWGRPWRSRG